MSDVRIMWPFEVDWSAAFRVTYQYLTDVFVNRSGGEQRRATRETPRKVIEFTSTLMNGAQLRTFNRLIETGQNQLVVMPEVTCVARSAAATTLSGATAMSVEAIPAWLAAGSEVVLAAGTRRAVASVSTVVGNLVTFTAAIGAWPVSTRIHPSRTGLLTAETAAPRLTNAIAQVSVQFSVEPGSESYAAGAASASLNGVEVFELQPNWSNAVDVKHIWPVAQVDFGTGRTLTHRPVDFPTRLHAAGYVGRTAAQADAIADIFHRAKGRRGSFYLATGENDLPPIASLTAAGLTLTVAGIDTYDAYAEDSVHRAVAVKLASGQMLYREVAVLGFSEGNTILTVTAPWGVNAAPSQVVRVSWLLLSRFNDDEITIEWLTNEVAQAQLALQSLPVVAPSDYLALRATVEGDNRVIVPGDDRAVVYLG